MSRRTCGLSAACALAVGTSGAAVMSLARDDGRGNSGLVRFTVGDIAATAVSDGQIAVPAWSTSAPDVAEAEAVATMQRRFITPPYDLRDTSVLLIETPTHGVLIDTGPG